MFTIAAALVIQLLNPFTALPASAHAAQSAPAAQPALCQEGTQPHGARYQVCLPAGEWNGDLVVYAHGYVPASGSAALPGEAGTLFAPLRQMGYAFATTSYRTNGLAVLPAQEDLLELVQLFNEIYGQPQRVFLIGFSEGGLITAQAVEQHPETFSGGLAGCGPIGDFQRQINYFGNFRVVFDAFFPGTLPGDPVNVPPEMADSWPDYYRQKVLPIVRDPGNRVRLEQILTITGAPFDPARPETIEQTIRGVLGYNAFATNDARLRMGGQPFDNQEYVYAGSDDDKRLNREVRRFAASPSALKALSAYQTGGSLRAPLVTIHTTGDEIVPAFHLDLYNHKVQASGSEDFYESILVDRYGHCSFTHEEVMEAFTRLIRIADTPIKATGAPSPIPSPANTPAPVVTAYAGTHPPSTASPAPSDEPEARTPAVPAQQPVFSPWRAIQNLLARLAGLLAL